VMFYGMLLEFAFVAVVGGILSALSLVGWFWPRGETQET